MADIIKYRFVGHYKDYKTNKYYKPIVDEIQLNEIGGDEKHLFTKRQINLMRCNRIIQPIRAQDERFQKVKLTKSGKHYKNCKCDECKKEELTNEISQQV